MRIAVTLLLLAVACDKPAPLVVDAASPAISSVAVAPSSPPVVASSAAPAASAPVPDAITAQHVLVAYKGAKNAPRNVTRTKSEALTRAKEVLGKAQAGEDFTELVKTYTDDPGSAERLGSVGKFTRDKMAKPFSDAAFALKVDGISDVVETPFGYHVIKRNQ